MATPNRNVVNLDALIPRQDLAAPVERATADVRSLKIGDLAGLSYSALRKPDFQRETANWSPDQIVDLIETFVKGDIIPAIILWQNGDRVFVVDGAHRLSALLAWVRDDYGAGDLSAAAHRLHGIPDQQRIMHDATQKLVNSKVHAFADYKRAAEHPLTANAKVQERAAIINWREIEIQWIKGASVEQAREAFFRINQGGTKIDPTETRILRARNSALAISSRAIARGGSGHSYWDRFESLDAREQIVSLGAKLHKMLFSPPLSVPIKTCDVPLAGFSYGAHVLPFSFELVVFANSLTAADSRRASKSATAPLFPDDTDGQETIRFLRRARSLVRLLLSTDPSSLGLHPALYSYTPSGEFNAAALLNLAQWVSELRDRNKINAFLDVRGKFEALILAHPVIIKPASHKLGSGARSRPRMVSLLWKILDLLVADKETEEVWEIVTTESNFSFLITDDHEARIQEAAGKSGAAFHRNTKSAGFFTQALPSVSKCVLCGGIMHPNGMVAHHKRPRSIGGSSSVENVGMVHPVCNSNDDQRHGKGN